MLRGSFLVFLATYLFCVYQVIGYNLLVKTDNGYVRGFEETSRANRSVKYFAFQGIPYAEPPLGSLRFKDPVAISSWNSIRNSTAFGENCVAYDASKVSGSEDCLYLNIYTRVTQEDNDVLSLPVMVWFHGGGFYKGSARSNPSYYIEKPVIVAAVAYRLGVTGFLSTLDENARGNAGLKDQNLALRWIKNNIKYFGGDPERITIVGQSAGGASVQYHVISPKSSGLFNQAISQSGSTLNEWGFLKDPLSLTLKLAKRLNITSTNTKEVIAALQQVDIDVLMKNSAIGGRFEPTVEAESEGAFISRSTYDMWTEGDFNNISLLIGYNSEEGSGQNGSAHKYATDHKRVIPTGLNINSDSTEAAEVIEAIGEIYFPGNSFNNYTNCINFMSQHFFVRGIRKTIGDFAKSSAPLYFYKFSYVTKENYTKGLNGGAGHAEEGKYTWHSTELANEDDVRTKDRLITMWTNFVIYGNPTPVKDELLENVIWPEAREGIETEDDLRYLEIGYNLVVGVSPDQKDFLFWRDLFKKYAKKTVYTY